MIERDYRTSPSLIERQSDSRPEREEVQQVQDGSKGEQATDEQLFVNIPQYLSCKDDESFGRLIPTSRRNNNPDNRVLPDED